MNNITKPVYMQVALSELLTTDPYQRRSLNQRLVKEIAENFNPLMVGVITVSRRDGINHIVDGRHRIAGATYGGFPKTFMFDCRIFTGLTYEQEAELFAVQDSNRVRLKPHQEFNGLLEAKDPETAKIQEILARVGLEVDLRQGGGEKKIFSVRKVQSLYRTMGANDFYHLMRLVRDTWGGAPDSLKEKIVGGCALFYTTYKGEFDEKTFVKKLGIISPTDIIRDGNADISTRGDLQYARVILRKYNYNLRHEKVLPYKFQG